jgi:formylglycine-generating enzyme required for sulfatase activity
MQACLTSPKNDMATIPHGVISLRDDRLRRSWSVEIQQFELARVPVCQSLYTSVTGRSPSSFDTPDAPVDSVSWLDAVAFCNALSEACGLIPGYRIDREGESATLADQGGYRLPTEAEWEYACRAGSQGPRYGELDAIAWYRDNAEGQSHPSGQKTPNAWGLHDMLGNVWEWCADQYDPEVYGVYRVFRGGGWNDTARGCLATNRRRSHPTFAIDDLGFRIARSCK